MKIRLNWTTEGKKVPLCSLQLHRYLYNCCILCLCGMFFWNKLQVHFSLQAETTFLLFGLMNAPSLEMGRTWHWGGSCHRVFKGDIILLPSFTPAPKGNFSLSYSCSSSPNSPSHVNALSINFISLPVAPHPSCCPFRDFLIYVQTMCRWLTSWHKMRICPLRLVPDDRKPGAACWLVGWSRTDQ